MYNDLDLCALVRQEVASAIGNTLTSYIEKKIKAVLLDAMKKKSRYGQAPVVMDIIQKTLATSIEEEERNDVHISEHKELLKLINTIEDSSVRTCEIAKQNFELLQLRFEKLSSDIASLSKDIKVKAKNEINALLIDILRDDEPFLPLRGETGSENDLEPAIPMMTTEVPEVDCIHEISACHSGSTKPEIPKSTNVESDVDAK